MQIISISSLSKVFALIGTIIGAWLFLSSTFVNAADYREDSLIIQASFVEMQLYALEDRIDRAKYTLNSELVDKLERRRNRLERQQEIIMEKQFE